MDGGYGYRNKIILDVRGRLTRGVEAGGPALIVGTAHSAALKEMILFCALRFHAMLDLWTCQAEQVANVQVNNASVQRITGYAARVVMDRVVVGKGK